MARAIAEGRLKLKPLPGAEPFLKRLTVRRYRSSFIEGEAETGVMGLGRIFQEDSVSFRNIITARRSSRKIRGLTGGKNTGHSHKIRGELSGLFDGVIIERTSSSPAVLSRTASDELQLEREGLPMANPSPVNTIGSDVPQAIKELLAEAELDGAL
jgi:hypothetical protein